MFNITFHYDHVSRFYYQFFIYAIIIEEYGLFAAIGIPLLFLYFLYRGARAVHEAMVPFGGLLSAGLTSSIVFQAFINMSAMLGIVPLTGLPLPFVSHGGTALLAILLSCGLILNVARSEAPGRAAKRLV